MTVIPLSEFGLVTVADVCAARGLAPKTVQNWINANLLPVVAVGTGRSAKFLLRQADVDAFTPPARGRPKAKTTAEPKPKKTAPKAPAKPRKAKGT